MNRIIRMAGHARHMDFYDYVNHGAAMLACLKTTLWYARFFANIGSRSWIKSPRQIYTPSRIHLGKAVRIESGSTLYAVKRNGAVLYKGRIQIGDRTFANTNFNVISAFGIRIGCDVAFGPNVFISDFDHDYEPLGVSRLSTPLVSKGLVSIGDFCWIGANVSIASGVDLGKECVVAANSVVTRSFPPRTVVAGSPARAVRRFDESSGQWLRAEAATGQFTFPNTRS